MHNKFTWLLSLVIIMLNVFYGAFALMQLKFLGKVLVQSINIKIAIMIILYTMLVIFLLLKSKMLKIIIDIKVFISYIIWILYSIISFICIFRFSYSLDYVMFTYFAILFYPILMIVFTVSTTNDPPIKEDIYNKVYKLLYIIAIIVSVVGILQYEFNLKILDISSYNDDYYKILSQDFYGSTRAVGFFNSGLDFGSFFVIILVLSLSKLLFDKINIIDIIMLILSAFCIYISLTRNVYIYAFASVLTVIYIKFIKKNSFGNLFSRLLPFLYLIITIIALSKMYSSLYNYTDFTANNNDITNSSSLIYRINTWGEYYTKYIVKGDLFNVLFGYGLIQNDKYSITRNIIADNTYLSLILYQGLIGLISFLGFFTTLWFYISRKCVERKNYFEITTLALVSAFLVRSMFNVTLFGDYLILILIFLVLTKIDYDTLLKK